MPYALPTFDELLDRILTDYRNQLPGADTSQGGLLFIKAACMASALWGAYKHQDWVSKQIFPDTAAAEQLDHHAWVRGLTRSVGESDADLLTRLLEHLRRPPAGGNKADYEKWAREIANVAAAYCYPIHQGIGTADVVVVADETATGSELPSSSARMGVTTSVTAGKLVDSAAAFTTGHQAAIGDVVRNTTQGTETTVSAVDSGTQLSLTDDIFKYVNDSYLVFCQTGTNTSTNTDKLIDSAGAFVNGTYTVKKGDRVRNLSDKTESIVVTVDSASQLTLAADIFTATGKKYVIESVIARVKEHIDSVRPVTASRLYVLAPTILTQNVDLAVTGANVSKDALAADITAYVKTLIPGQTLYRAKLTGLAMSAGADNCTITTPATDIVPTAQQMIRPGTVSVS